MFVGALGAWTTQAARVFLETLGVPLVLVVMHLLLPPNFPARTKLADTAGHCVVRALRAVGGLRCRPVARTA